MEPTRLQRLLTIVDQALALEGEERLRYLNEVCGKDTVLRGEVGKLLESVGESDSFWEGWRAWNEREIVELFQGADDPEASRRFGVGAEEQIGPWRLIRPLGRGGMGTVWLAERTDGSYEQQVALKLLHKSIRLREMDQSIRRFEQERQILAQLDHPHIARLYDGGYTAEGLPWLAMEYIDGQPIVDWCRRQNSSLKQRLELFEEICRAIRYAHRNLIVHRDLKPENILVTKEGHVKILDFGIAKLLDDQFSTSQRVQTRTGLRAMSLYYAAPEQITGEPVTTATDVYALGLLLYELLTGSYPYNVEDKNRRQIEQMIRTEEPVKPSTFQSRDLTLAGSEDIRGDLDAIAMKALRKESDHRYESAGQMLDDIDRYQKHRPVMARRGTVQYRVGKWLRRHRWTAVSGLAVLLSLVIGTGVALWQAREARQSAERATLALAETEQALSRAEALQEFLLDLFRSTRPDRPQDQLPTTEEILELGAEQALDEDSAPPAERVEMLLLIGRIYRINSHHDEALPLLEAAVELAREDAERRPELLAQALWDYGNYHIDMRDYKQAKVLFEEAESYVAGSETHWKMYAAARASRISMENRLGNHKTVIDMAEPLYAQMLERGEIDDRAQFDLLNALAGAHRRLGNLSSAATFNTELLELAESRQGPESTVYAVLLSNSVEVEFLLGRFEEAEARSRAAIDLYDRIFGTDTANQYRAPARLGLAYTLLYAGRFEEALEELEASSIEWAEALGRSIDEWGHPFLNRGKFLAWMHRWDEAEESLREARKLFTSAGNADDRLLNEIDTALAWTLCRQGKIDEHETVLSELEVRLESGQPESRRKQADIHEARATCYFRSGSMTPALNEIDTALALLTDYTGLALHQADRRILRARILVALGRGEEAEQELDRAEQAFLDLDLADHPHFSQIEAVRQELFGNDDF